MSWNFDTKGTAGQVLAAINGINAGSSAQLEVNSLGYAQSAMRSILSDMQSTTLTKTVALEFHVVANGGAAGKANRFQIFFEIVPLDANLNIQSVGVN